MRLVSLRLAPFGAFSDTTVELHRGVTVVHGANESGKSTMLAACTDLLCGIRVPAVYDFAAARKDLRIHGSVVLDDGTALSVVRSSRRAPHDLVDEATGRPLDDDVLARFGALRAEHQHLARRYGLDHERLVTGGRSLMRGTGDVADLVFDARAGVDVRALVTDLRQRAESIYKPRKNGNAEINALLEQREQLEAELHEALVTAEQVAAARSAETAAAWARDAGLADTRAARAEHDRLSRLLESWTFAADREDAVHALALLDGEGDRLDDTEVAQVVVVLQRLAAITREAAELETRLMQAREEIARLQVDEALLPHRDEIDTLASQRSAIDDAGTEAATEAESAEDTLVRLRAALTDLGLTDVTDAFAALARVHVPADTAADLDSRAARGEVLRTDVDAAERAVRIAADAVAELSAAITPALDSGTELDHARLAAARDAREQRWQQVRAAWLLGREVDRLTPESLADAYETAVVDADAEADSLAAEAGDLGDAEREAVAAAASAAATLAERRRALDRSEQDLADAASRLDSWQQEWADAVVAAGLDASTGAAGWLARAAVLAIARDLAATASEHERRRARAADRVDAWTEHVVALGAALDEAVSPSTAVAFLTRTKASLDSSLRDQKAVAVHRGHAAAAVDSLSLLAAERLELDAELAAVAVHHGVEVVDLHELLDRAQRASDLAAEVDATTALLRARHLDDLDDVIEALAATTHDELVDAVDHAAGVADALEAGAEQLREQAQRRIEERARLESADGAEQLHQALVGLDAQIADKVEAWALLTIKEHLLAAEVRAYADAHANPVLDRAGRYLARLTDGRYSHVRAHTDGTDRGLLVVTDDTELDSAQLSEGTATQLYLALVLATLVELQQERRADGHETLPLLLDDVLMTFDDIRSAAALELLAEIGAEQQVVVLTHHDSVRDAALTVDGVAVVSLGTRDAVAASIDLADVADVEPAPVVVEVEREVAAAGLEHDVLVGDPMDLLELVAFDAATTTRAPKKSRGRTA